MPVIEVSTKMPFDREKVYDFVKNNFEQFPKFIENIKELKLLRKLSSSKLITAWTVDIGGAFVEKALSYGAKGYILKDSAADEVVKAIREVYEGRYFLSPKVSSMVVHDYALKKQKTIRIRSISMLTPRERELLQLIAEGRNNKEIAQRLNISLKTVLVHRNNIMQKLDIHNQAQLIRFALKEGISSL